MLSIKKTQTYCSLKFSIIPLGGAMYWSAPGLGVGIPCAGTLGATVVTPGKNNTQPETYLFNRKIVAQYVRIYPKQYTGAPAIRFNLLGCNPSAAVTTPAPTLPPGVTTVAPSVPAQGIPT
jgi:hypothetical protein